MYLISFPCYWLSHEVMLNPMVSVIRLRAAKIRSSRSGGQVLLLGGRIDWVPQWFMDVYGEILSLWTQDNPSFFKRISWIIEMGTLLTNPQQWSGCSGSIHPCRSRNLDVTTDINWSFIWGTSPQDDWQLQIDDLQAIQIHAGSEGSSISTRNTGEWPEATEFSSVAGQPGWGNAGDTKVVLGGFSQGESRPKIPKRSLRQCVLCVYIIYIYILYIIYYIIYNNHIHIYIYMHSRSTAKTQRRRGGAGSGAQGEELGWARADESTRQTRELLFVEPWQACYIIYIIIVGYIYIWWYTYKWYICIYV